MVCMRDGNVSPHFEKGLKKWSTLKFIIPTPML